MKYLMVIILILTLVSCESYYVGYDTNQDNISVNVVYKDDRSLSDNGKFTNGSLYTYPSMIQGKGTIKNKNSFAIKVTQYRTMHSHHNPGTKLIDVYKLMAGQEKEIQMSATELFVISDMNNIPITTMKATYWKLPEGGY